MVLAAALRACPSIVHGAALRLLVKSLLLTLLIFALLSAALWAGVHALRQHQGWMPGVGWGGLAEATATALIVIAAGWLLFRATAMAIMSLFADDIVIAIERDSYPAAAARARPSAGAAAFGSPCAPSCGPSAGTCSLCRPICCCW